MLLKIEKKGGGLPLLAAALSACPADCHPGLDPGGQHLATCCLVRMATKVGSPFLLASKTSSSTPSPKGTPLKNPGCHPGLVPGSPFHPRKRLANSAPAQPAPHADKLRPSAFTVRLAARLSPSLSLGVHFVVLAVGIFLIILNVLLRHNNPQWHSVRNADFLFKILQLNVDC